MRRESIYLHRSVRSFPISPLRAYTGVGMAILLSAAVGFFGTTLLSLHSRLSWFILRRTGIPATGSRLLDIFPHIGPVLAPDIPFPDARGNPFKTIVLFGLCLLVLILTHRKYPLSRNFIIFLFVLLGTAGGVIVFYPSFPFDSGIYEQIWLRGEILVWLLLPWISAFLFFLTLPSVAGGIGWTLLLQMYAVVWSALRLAFCLGVLHFTGIVFLPLLWFCLGILFDLVYVLVFYSLALKSSIILAGGERKP